MTIQELSVIMDDLMLIKTPLVIDNCDTVTFTTNGPVRVYLAMDPAFDTNGTFIQYSNWELTGETFAFIDAENWVDEVNEHNNFITTDTVCHDYNQFTFVSDWDWKTDSMMIYFLCLWIIINCIL